MTVPRLLAILVVFPLAGFVRPAAAAQARDYGCSEWRHCRELALAALDRGEYETFHDLAWRAVQTGPPKDPALMYLLARAQSLSGRPRDALVMLDRLAEMGVASDAATNEDFVRTRQLEEWPEVEARIERLREPAAEPRSPAAAFPPPAPAPAAAAAPAAALPPARSSPAAEWPTVRLDSTEAVRLPTASFSVSGLAYDAVSERFVFGDRLGRRLIVVGERSNRAMDLVRAESAGFQDIAAMEIDARRGDLWVASGADGAARLHRLHLASGRPLRAFDAPAGTGPIAPVDLTVGPAGAVMMLDAATPQLLRLRPGEASLEPLMGLDAEGVSSVTAGPDDRTAFVAHRGGVLRIDLQARRAVRVALPAGLSLAPIERIRWRSGALVAITADATGARQVHRLAVSGSRITRAAVLDASLPPGRRAFVTLAGDELLYVLERPASGGASGRDELVTYRVRLP